jgi:hypothetical protein
MNTQLLSPTPLHQNTQVVYEGRRYTVAACVDRSWLFKVEGLGYLLILKPVDFIPEL